MLQKYDAERDEAKLKFDLERDAAQRKFIAAMWGVDLKDSPTKAHNASANGQGQKLTKEDIMQNYRQ